MRRAVLLSAIAVAVLPGAALLPVQAAPELKVVAAYDLFQTDSAGTHYGPLHFQGVKGCRRFPQAKNTDTVVQRKQTATRSKPRIEIQAQCLQLRGAFLDTAYRSPVFRAVDGMVSVGTAVLPVDQVFVTLQTDRGRHPGDASREAISPAKPSLGTLDFRFDRSGCGGTFDSTLKVFFDVRAGSLDGPIVYSTDQFSAPMFYSYDTPWGCALGVGEGGFRDTARSIVDSSAVTRVDCPSALRDVCTDEHQVGAPADLVPGLNFMMNGRSKAGDFFPNQSLQ